MKLLNEIFEFKKGNFEQLREDIKEALLPIARKYNLIIEPGNISYTENNLTLKLNVSRNIDPADQFMINYRDSYLFAYDITKDMYGKTFTGQDGKLYKLVGIKRLNRRTNRVLIIQNSNGTEFVCTPEFLGINQKGNVHVNFNR